jgi:hypothetical protein
MEKLKLETGGAKMGPSIPDGEGLTLKKGPLTVRDDGRTGHPTMNDFHAASNHGFVQTSGTGGPGPSVEAGEAVTLGRTPEKGWDSYPTPISTRAKKQQGNGK